MKNGKIVWLRLNESLILVYRSYDEAEKRAIPSIGNRFWIPADAKMNGLY